MFQICTIFHAQYSPVTEHCTLRSFCKEDIIIDAIPLKLLTQYCAEHSGWMPKHKFKIIELKVMKPRKLGICIIAGRAKQLSWRLKWIFFWKTFSLKDFEVSVFLADCTIYDARLTSWKLYAAHYIFIRPSRICRMYTS